jgi:NAD(P)-dependent dehydrogenase (short-subunit alcohol dehydrogenase family)
LNSRAAGRSSPAGAGASDWRPRACSPPPAALAESVSIGRLVTAEEVADVIAFLASPRSVAINGDAIAVGGGAKGAIHY